MNLESELGIGIWVEMKKKLMGGGKELKIREKKTKTKKQHLDGSQEG